MVKRGSAILPILAVLGLLGAGCSSAPRKSSSAGGDHPLPFQPSDRPMRVEKAWTQRIHGILTDLAVARSGAAVAIATSPDRESEQGTSHYELARYDGEGRLSWRHEMSSPVKVLAISGDGSLVAVTTYDNELSGVSASGKTLWKAESLCRPYVLDHPKRILCYHDDDAESDIAFDVFDWEGNKLLSFPVVNDIMALKISRDQTHVALGLTGGQVILIGPDFRAVWQSKAKGEILDLAVSDGPEPRVAALTSDQKLFVFGPGGKLVSQGATEVHAEQVELTPDGGAVLTYGNSPAGQFLSSFAGAPKLERKWKRGASKYADYSSSMIVTASQALMGFEDIAESTRHSHILGFDFSGDLKTNIPLVTEEGAYLYAQGLAEEAALLAVGTDDGNLSAYRLRQ